MRLPYRDSKHCTLIVVCNRPYISNYKVCEGLHADECSDFVAECRAELISVVVRYLDVATIRTGQHVPVFFASPTLQSRCCRRAGLPGALADKLLSFVIPAQPWYRLCHPAYSAHGLVSAALVCTGFCSTGWCWSGEDKLQHSLLCYCIKICRNFMTLGWRSLRLSTGSRSISNKMFAGSCKAIKMHKVVVSSTHHIYIDFFCL